MKTKEIIEKAGIANGFDKRNQEVFFGILVAELKETYNGFGAKDSARHFDAAVKVVRVKWDSISNKIPNGLSNGVWSFFYANYAGPLKNELCPTWRKANDEWVAKRDAKRNKKSHE